MPAGTITDASPRVRVIVGRRLPQGRLVARAEVEHSVIFIVSPEAHRRPAEFLQQLENVMQEAITSRTWGRNPLIPPQNMPTE